MNHLALVLLLFVITTSFNKQDLNTKPAASILTIYNNTSGTTITSVKVTRNSGTSFTITTNTTPGNSYVLNMGNTSEYIFVQLNLSSSISCSMKVTDEDDIYDCPWIACSGYTNTSTPTIYFYMYDPLYLYLTNTQYCFC